MAEKEKINPEEEEIRPSAYQLPELTEEIKRRSDALGERWAKLSREERLRLVGYGKSKSMEKDI